MHDLCSRLSIVAKERAKIGVGNSFAFFHKINKIIPVLKKKI